MVLGLVLDRYGPRACSVASIAFSFFGFLLFGVAGEFGREHSETLFTLRCATARWLELFLTRFVGRCMKSSKMEKACVRPGFAPPPPLPSFCGVPSPNAREFSLLSLNNKNLSQVWC
jgi:hypothetical protein